MVCQQSLHTKLLQRRGWKWGSTINGAQPSGFVSLDYECESSVVVLPDNYSMVVSVDGITATFDYAGFVKSMLVMGKPGIIKSGFVKSMLVMG